MVLSAMKAQHDVTAGQRGAEMPSIAASHHQFSRASRARSIAASTGATQR
jgi:hypothetical protein